MTLQAIPDLIIGIAGVGVVSIFASDVFQSVIVPRPVTSWRPSALISRNGWRLTGAIGLRFRDAERRESFYGVYAPLLLVTLMAFWVVGLTVGFGLIFFALRSELQPVTNSYWSAVYYAGTSLLTLGYGDITAHRGLARALSLAAAAVGLATFATVTAFLFSLFAAFQRREVFIVTLRERTGAPPSGTDFIERHVDLGMLDDLPAVFRNAEAWMADIMETHLAYPVLSYFRSTHDNQSWVGTIGALLDAATIIITTVDLGSVGQAKMMSRLGRHLVNDYTQYYSLPGASQDEGAVGIERVEFDKVYERFALKGVRMRPIETAWLEFSALRASYAVPLNAMARYWRIPPALWIGDRSLISSRHSPAPVVRRTV
jgi:hypothetical protein